MPRNCSVCTLSLEKESFSHNQWSRTKMKRVCIACQEKSKSVPLTPMQKYNLYWDTIGLAEYANTVENEKDLLKFEKLTADQKKLHIAGIKLGS